MKMGKRTVPVLAAAALGIGWLFLLSQLTNGQGLVAIDMRDVILNWSLVGVSFCVSFIFYAQIGWLALLGWLGGQFAFLIYDGLPKGRSPVMFQPTNVGEAVLLAGLVVAWLNWPAIFAAIGGYFIGRGARKK